MTRRKMSRTALMERLVRAEGKCAECGCKVGGAAGLEWDHIIALELGGDDTIENLQPLCKICHKVKTRGDVGKIAKAKRCKARQAGIRKPAKRPLPGSKASGWKSKIGGGWERR